MLLLLKLLLSPALIGIASWVSRRWGAAAGGWCSALPLTSGPAVLVLALEHGPVFAAQASAGALLALVSLAAFALAYSWSASGADGAALRRRNRSDGMGHDSGFVVEQPADVGVSARRSGGGGGAWLPSEARGHADAAARYGSGGTFIFIDGGWRRSSLAGCVAYLVCTIALWTVSLSLMWTFAIACLALFGTVRVMPTHATRGQAAPRRWWDIPLRMALAAVLVLALTRAAGAFGARMSGLLTPFPIGATILAGFTHAFEGAAAASQLLRGLVSGLFSFAVFFLVTGFAITRWNTATTFATATLVTLAFHAVAWRWSAGQRPAVARLRSEV